ncbi:hypothetical protein MJO29_010759 [Puccinia striiformis f. sp. tritici]|nr:hypothetical protein MJO29_010759 [Puccinia striiformis f. sp. tritici]
MGRRRVTGAHRGANESTRAEEAIILMSDHRLPVIEDLAVKHLTLKTQFAVLILVSSCVSYDTIALRMSVSVRLR